MALSMFRTFTAFQRGNDCTEATNALLDAEIPQEDQGRQAAAPCCGHCAMAGTRCAAGPVDLDEHDAAQALLEVAAGCNTTPFDAPQTDPLATVQVGQIGAQEVPKPPTVAGPNPAVEFVPEAWDFAACTYVIQAGDTIDGLAQTYLGSPPGDYQGPGSAGGINQIGDANPPGSRPACFRSLDSIDAGCKINMPQAACDKAKATLAQYKQDCISSGNVWTGGADPCGFCCGCTANASANTVAVSQNGVVFQPGETCVCNDGYGVDAQGNCVPLPPPSPGCSGGKVLNQNGQCVCPQGTHDDGSGNCVSDAAKPKAAQGAPVPAGLGAGWWAVILGVPAILIGGALLKEKKR